MLAWIENILHILGPWALILLFIYLCVESIVLIGLFIPADIIVLFAGAMAGQHLYDAADVIVIVAIATTLGDVIGYLIGRRWGRPLIAKWPWLRRHYEEYRRALETRLAHWTMATMLFTRIAGIGHSFVPFGCGMTKINFVHYTAAALVSESIWGGGLAFAGYMLGRHWQVVNAWLESVGGGLITLLLLVVIFMMLRRWFRGWRQQP